MKMVTLPQNAINYVKGIMCVFENANCVSLAKVADCSHDSLTRALKRKKFNGQTLLKNFILRTFGKLQDGWLIIDDTLISKPFAKSIENLAWIFDSKIGKSVLGLQIVLIAWSNGKVTIPLAFRVYQKNTGRSKIDLACELVKYARNLGIKPKYVAFDSWYAASQLCNLIKSYHWIFVCQLKCNRKLNGIALVNSQRNPYWVKTGKLTSGLEVLVVRNGKKYFATNNLVWSKQELLAAYKTRWDIETIFKALHSKLGLDGCQTRKISSQINHFYFCLLAYTALEQEGFIKNKTFYQIKRNCSFDFQYADNIVNKLFFQGA